ncbi:MAG TPA: antitermination protein NusG [Coriobacteriia bacterium]|nr:antitermination protein NusG [Coriobacteriia bacterium]
MTDKYKWYAVQVVAGREKRTLELLNKLVGKAQMKECFIAQYERQKKFAGTWRKCTEIFFPGYLFVSTDKVEQLAQQLTTVPTFTRLLGNEQQFIPLTLQETALIESFTGDETRIVRMSEGFIENDEVFITGGPLANQAAVIRKIDRHKRLAYLEIVMFGQVVRLKAGLEIVRKNNSKR